MIKAIFLDAGGVILDETQFEIIKSEIITGIIKKHRNYSTGEYWCDSEEAVLGFVSSTYEYVLFKNIPDLFECKNALKQFKEAWKASNWEYKEMVGIEELLKVLSSKYKIGILGQYDSSLVDYLDEKKLLKYFSFTETQEKYKTTKPDPRYFLDVISNAKLQPNECIMIGDRIDKDIYPANIVGMRNIRVKTGLHLKQEPRIFIEVPDYTVNSLSEISLELIESIETRSSFDNPHFW